MLNLTNKRMFIFLLKINLSTCKYYKNKSPYFLFKLDQSNSNSLECDDRNKLAFLVNPEYLKALFGNFTSIILTKFQVKNLLTFFGNLIKKTRIKFFDFRTDNLIDLLESNNKNFSSLTKELNLRINSINISEILMRSFLFPKKELLIIRSNSL